MYSLLLYFPKYLSPAFAILTNLFVVYICRHFISRDEGLLAFNVFISIAVIGSRSRKSGQQNSTLRAPKDFFLPARRGK